MALLHADGDATRVGGGATAHLTLVAHARAALLSPPPLFCVCAWRRQQGAPPHVAAHGLLSLPPPFHWHRHCCVHVAVPMVRRDHSAMRHAVTAPLMSEWECVSLRRVSALTPAHPHRVVLCACDSVCIVPADHSRCLTHSLPHPSPPRSSASSACARKHSACRRRHRSLPPTSLLAASSASRRHTFHACSAMHSSAQLLVFANTKRQFQRFIFYLMRERSMRRVPMWDARRLRDMHAYGSSSRLNQSSRRSRRN